MERLKNKGKRGLAVLSVLIATTLAVTLFAALPADDSGSSRESTTLGAAGNYHAGDVAVINSIIENNGLTWAPNSPDSWPKVEWDNASPKRIRELSIPFLSLTGALNVSGLTLLIKLDCSGNYLTSLDVSGLTSLIDLDCIGNDLTSLDVSGLTSLMHLDCSGNKLTSLNVSGLTSLRTLNCTGNDLTSLNMSGLTNLFTLNCNGNKLTSLDVSGLTNLSTLNCNGNYLTSLNVSGLTNLSTLNCSGNYLTSLNMSGLTNLFTLNCNGNYLTSLDVSGLYSLTELNCNGNKLTSLDVSGLTSIIKLDCNGNKLTSLDVSGLSSLIKLDCIGNDLTSLDVSGLTSIIKLDCIGNKLTSLDVSGLSSLIKLDCIGNDLTSLDVSGLALLEKLECGGNYLTELDLSGLTSLTELDCNGNYLTSLDVSDLSQLSYLRCDRNLMKDESKVTITGTNLGAPSSTFYFGIQYEAVEIKDGMSEAEISEAIEDIIKDGVHVPLVIGTITSNTGTLAINTGGGEICWRAVYTGGTLELDGSGTLSVEYGGAINVNKMLIKGGCIVFVSFDGTIAVKGNMIIEGEFSSLMVDDGKVTVNGDLIAEDVTPSEYAATVYSGEITVLGDAISSGGIFLLDCMGVATVGGNAIAGGDYAFFCGPGSAIHVKGDVISLNGYGVYIYGTGIVKIDGALYVQDKESYICDENGPIGIGDHSFENENGYAFVYTDGLWYVYIGSEGSGKEEPGTGNGTGDNGEESDIGSNGSGNGNGHGTGTEHHAYGNEYVDAFIIFAVALTVLVALSYFIVIRK